MLTWHPCLLSFHLLAFGSLGCCLRCSETGWGLLLPWCFQIDFWFLFWGSCCNCRSFCCSIGLHLLWLHSDSFYVDFGQILALNFSLLRTLWIQSSSFYLFQGYWLSLFLRGQWISDFAILFLLHLFDPIKCSSFLESFVASCQSLLAYWAWVSERTTVSTHFETHSSLLLISGPLEPPLISLVHIHSRIQTDTPSLASSSWLPSQAPSATSSFIDVCSSFLLHCDLESGSRILMVV